MSSPALWLLGLLTVTCFLGLVVSALLAALGGTSVDLNAYGGATILLAAAVLACVLTVSRDGRV